METSSVSIYTIEKGLSFFNKLQEVLKQKKGYLSSPEIRALAKSCNIATNVIYLATRFGYLIRKGNYTEIAIKIEPIHIRRIYEQISRGNADSKAKIKEAMKSPIFAEVRKIKKNATLLEARIFLFLREINSMLPIRITTNILRDTARKHKTNEQAFYEAIKCGIFTRGGRGERNLINTTVSEITFVHVAIIENALKIREMQRIEKNKLRIKKMGIGIVPSLAQPNTQLQINISENNDSEPKPKIKKQTLKEMVLAEAAGRPETTQERLIRLNSNAEFQAKRLAGVKKYFEMRRKRNLEEAQEHSAKMKFTESPPLPPTAEAEGRKKESDLYADYPFSTVGQAQQRHEERKKKLDELDEQVLVNRIPQSESEKSVPPPPPSVQLIQHYFPLSDKNEKAPVSKKSVDILWGLYRETETEKSILYGAIKIKK